MSRLGLKSNNNSPRVTELNHIKEELQRVTKQLESRKREQTATSEIFSVIAGLSTDLQSTQIAPAVHFHQPFADR